MLEEFKIVIAEDHALFRDGIKAMLESKNGLKVVGEAADGIEAVRMVREHCPHLLLLDLSMPRMNGASAIREIKRQFPDTNILVVTVHKTDEHVLEVFQAGAKGYCLKDSGRKELMGAVESVLAGKIYLDPGIADKVLEGYIEGRKKLKSESSLDSLSTREKEVLKLVGEGYQNKEISSMLNISIKTVEKHRSNIMAKLDLHSASALTAYAIQNGLVSPER